MWRYCFRQCKHNSQPSWCGFLGGGGDGGDRDDGDGEGVRFDDAGAGGGAGGAGGRHYWSDIGSACQTHLVFKASWNPYLNNYYRIQFYHVHLKLHKPVAAKVYVVSVFLKNILFNVSSAMKVCTVGCIDN